eukprot:403337522
MLINLKPDSEIQNNSRERLLFSPLTLKNQHQYQQLPLNLNNFQLTGQSYYKSKNKGNNLQNTLAKQRFKIEGQTIDSNEDQVQLPSSALRKNESGEFEQWDKSENGMGGVHGINMSDGHSLVERQSSRKSITKRESNDIRNITFAQQQKQTFGITLHQKSISSIV